MGTDAIFFLPNSEPGNRLPREVNEEDSYIYRFLATVPPRQQESLEGTRTETGLKN